MHELSYWKNHRWAWVKRCFFNYVKFAAVASRLLRVEDIAARSRYRLQLLRILRSRWREPHILFIYALKVTFHYHFAAIAAALHKASETSGAMPTAGRSFSRVKRRVEEPAAAQPPRLCALVRSALYRVVRCIPSVNPLKPDS